MPNANANARSKIPVPLLVVSALLLMYCCFRPRCAARARAAPVVKTATATRPASAEFVMFHSPSCGHCVRAMPAFDRLQPPPHVRKVKVDCQARPEMASAHGVNAYPTFRLYPHGMAHPEDFVTYTGARDENAFYDFLAQRRVRFEK
jgi:thiol-disulfide isomerase/thioredoxin